MLTVLLASVLCAAPANSHAPRAVLVLPVMPGPRVEAEHVQSVRSALRRRLGRVEDVRFLDTVEQNVWVVQGNAHSGIRCDDVECAAELGLAVGVPEVLMGSLEGGQDQYALRLARVSTRSMKVLRAAQRHVKVAPATAVTQPLSEMVEELYPSLGGCAEGAQPVARLGAVSRVTSEDTPQVKPPVRTYPRAPDVTWMLPTIAGVTSALALAVVIGGVPFALSAVVMPAGTAFWLNHGMELMGTGLDEQRAWVFVTFLLPALIGLPMGLAAPVAATAAAFGGWFLPTWLWRRNSPGVGWVLAAAVPPALLGALAVAGPLSLGGLAATSFIALKVPGLANVGTVPVMLGAYAAAWMGATALTYLTALGTLVLPAAAVGLALSRDDSPLRKPGEEEPLPVDELLQALDDDPRRRPVR
ncbi:MAG: UbiA family prenyltransferase [Myxococcota bacterium]